MLTNTNQKISFEQFLFSHFEIKKNNESVLETDSCGADDNNKEVVVEKVTCQPVKKAKAKKVIKKVEACKSVKKTIPSTEEKVATLAEAIDSIPDKVKSLDINELAHQHESEWYHTFRDLQEEIANDIAKKQPHYGGVVKLKAEIEEFWEQLDEHIEKASLEIERVFQAFPHMSRVAVIYLLSFVIAIPLVFFSAHQDKNISYEEVLNNKLGSSQTKIIHFTKEMKSDYVAKHSAEILASGKTLIQVTEGIKTARVAGAYENNSLNFDGNMIKRKISNYYSYISELKDEFIYGIKKKLSK